MKGLLFLTAVLCSIATSVVVSADEGVSFTLSPRVLSSYVGSAGFKIHDEPVLQTDFLVAFPRGFYLDVWHSAGLDGTSISSDFGDEMDYTLGWAGELASLKLDLGIAYFDLLEVGRMPRGDMFQPFVEVGKSFAPAERQTLTPYLRLEALYPAKGSTPENGTRLHVGVKHEWNPGGRLAISQRFTLVHDDGVGGLDSGFIWAYQFEANWKVVKNVTVDLPVVRLFVPLTHFSDGRRTEAVVGAGITLRFP